MGIYNGCIWIQAEETNVNTVSVHDSQKSDPKCPLWGCRFLQLSMPPVSYNPKIKFTNTLWQGQQYIQWVYLA